MSFCTSCGQKCESDDRFCGNCGAACQVHEAKAQAVQNPTASKIQNNPVTSEESYRFWLPRTGKGQAIFLFLVGFMTSYIAAGFKDEGGVALVLFAAAVSWFGLSVWRFVFVKIYKVF